MVNLPSPTPSNSTPELSGLQSATKKRQRSASMQSATSSSSPKRSQSQGPIQEATPTQALSVTEYTEDIDIPMSVASPPPSDENSPPVYAGDAQAIPMWQDVPGEQKHRLADAMRNATMSVGETWYLVSAQWFRRWRKAVTGTEDKDGQVEEKDLGPVDNSDLLEDDRELVSTIEEGMNVFYVPEQLWDMFTAWYGKPTHPLPRKVRAAGARQEPTLEIRPPKIKPLLLVQSNDPAITGSGKPPLTLSAETTVGDLRRRLIQTFTSGDAHPPFRVWRLVHPRTAVTGLQYPTSRLLEVGGELLADEDSKTLEDVLIQSGDMLAIEIAQDGNWLVDTSKVPPAGDPEATQEELPPPLFTSENNFFNRMQTKSGSGPAPASSRVTTRDAISTSSAFSKYAPISRLADGGAKNRNPGTLGLGNMGNTCFMNSALQCLSHTRELVDYFLTGVFKDELNPDNPLGMKGEIAEAFGALLQRIWSGGSASSYSPREFKQALQRFAPQFSGYQQHDSQELVAFLLDGLHEDLNRILKKPFVEKPDWEGGGDCEMVELARVSWEGYLKRNDSVIVDLFQGQYRSTLICPECQKVSITFDPFMYLTLPLPITKKWKHTIFYIPWDLEKPHVKVPVEINADASFKDLRNLLGRWMEADPNNLATMEIFNHRFYKALDDNVLCGETGNTDILVCYELPCHAQQNRSYKKQPDDPFVLPVSLHRETNMPRQSYGRNTSGVFGYPFMVAITQEQARNAALIYEAIIDRLQRWTVHARDLYTWHMGSGDAIMEEVPIPSAPGESITEIQENGEVVTFPAPPPEPEEGDIVDEKSALVTGRMGGNSEVGVPQRGSAKPGIFTIKLGAISATSYNSFASASGPFTSLESRQTEADAALLREGDSIICEFDENMRDYFFGDHARWDTTLWEDFIHPELREARTAATGKPKRGIVLQDCLDEFVKEEQLGEDDLWYCPRCKKHQQATKKFDLWKAPDVLVVHLKRFSNSRSLRDKIDTFVDFPIEGLDLEPMIEERKVAKRLQENGVDTSGMGLNDWEDPLIYDLFAVDEHIGGLGGGHYRAYAQNHVTEKWYHFDDSHVSESRTLDAVNANAYLLFYRRRSGHPLGGKTVEKIEEARLKVSQAESDSADQKDASSEHQLPTPPDEGLPRRLRKRTVSEEIEEGPTDWMRRWKGPREVEFPSQSPAESGSPTGLAYPDAIEELQLEPDPLFPLELDTHNFDFPDPSSSRTSLSPLSSGDLPLGSTQGTGHWSSRASPGSRQEPITFDDLEDAMPAIQSASRASASASNIDGTVSVPTSAEPVKEIPIEESTLLDIE